MAAEFVVAVKTRGLFVAKCAMRCLALLWLLWCSSDLSLVFDGPIRLRHRNILRSVKLLIRGGTIIRFSLRHQRPSLSISILLLYSA